MLGTDKQDVAASTLHKAATASVMAAFYMFPFLLERTLGTPHNPLWPSAGSWVERIDTASFPGQMSYKATKPGCVCPLSLNIFY